MTLHIATMILMNKLRLEHKEYVKKNMIQSNKREHTTEKILAENKIFLLIVNSNA
jgi:hypothetical protein